MNYKKIVFSISFLVVFSFLSFAGIPSAKAVTVDELRAQIQALQAQIQQLQVQLAQIQGQPVQWCHDFKVNLKIEMGGNEVKALQTALEKEGFTISQDEKDNKKFGESTASTVTGFQQKYKDEILTPLGLQYGTGFVGNATRAKLNKLYGCGIIKPPTTSSITVLSPNGGELWEIGKTYEIRWNPGAKGKSVAISLVDEKNIGYGTQTGLPIGTENDGFYLWTIPSAPAGVEPGKYKIRISCFTDCDFNSVFSDDSDGFFTIMGPTQNKVTVISPNGGEVWQIGSTQKIRWQGSIQSIHIYKYNQPVGAPVIDIVNHYGIPDSSGEFSWTILSAMEPGLYILQINGCCGGNVYNDNSDAPFSIVAPATTPSITVVSPNGGEKWSAGTTQTIKWTPSSSGTVRLEIRKGALPYVMIGSGGIPDTGSYAWPIPTGFTLECDYRVRITKSDGAGQYDESDGAFCIAAATTTENRFIIEAENYSNRTVTTKGSWYKVDGGSNKFIEGPKMGELAPTAKSGANGNYMEVLGTFIGDITPISENYQGPFLDYNVSIKEAGTYNLYLRWTGRDGNTDSVYAFILNPDGTLLRRPGPDYLDFFLYHGRTNWIWDNIGLKNRIDTAYAGRDAYAVWIIPAPGVYTIRLALRETETAVDALIFQTKDMPAPIGYTTTPSILGLENIQNQLASMAEAVNKLMEEIKGIQR